MKFELPKIPRRDQEAIDALRAHREANPLPLSPCVDQTAEEIEAYYRAAGKGSTAVVRHTQGGHLKYDVTEVEGGSASRVYVRGAGSFYRKSGANCFHPKGQTSLVVPTEAVLTWAAANRNGQFGYFTRRP